MCKIGIAVWVLLVIALVGLPAGVQAQSDDGLVAKWHFDEGAGSVLKDSSGNGNDGTIYGATWVEGKYGYALQFDGVDDKVKLPYSVINGLTDVTSEFWIKTTDTNAGVITGANSGSYNEYLIYWKCTNQIRNDIKNINHEISVSAITDGNWHHVAAIRTVSDVRIYIDGNFEGVWTNPPIGTLKIDPNGLWLGCEQDSVGGGWEPNQQFEGIIDDVRIYNRALSAEEIKAHYEQGPTSLSLTKTVSPQSIKQGQTTTITLTVKNTGTTEIKDIEIADTIPQDLIFIDGKTSKTYSTLTPKDSRQFQYVVQINEAGIYNLGPATSTYADEKGNYHTVKSKSVTIEVIPSLIATTDQIQSTTGSNAQTASVHLHGEKTDVALGEDILLKLAAVNLITKPTMHVQVIITPPSGMSVTSSEFVQSGAGLFMASYEIEPGVGRDIEVKMRSNQVGDFVVSGRIVYYFGDDMDNAEDHTLTLPITVRAGAEAGAERTTGTSESGGSSAPGFAAVVAVAGVLLVALLIKRRRLQ